MISKMKKIVLGLLLMILGMSSNIKAQTFNGIEVGKHITETRTSLLSKGFTQVRVDGETEEYTGNVNGTEITITTVNTPESKIVWKLIVEVDANTTWYSCKSSYNKYKEILGQKYVKSISLEFFSEPYYEGDGFEIQAIVNEKCVYSSYFKDDVGNTIQVRLIPLTTRKVGTWIIYQNKNAADICKKERKEINDNTF